MNKVRKRTYPFKCKQYFEQAHEPQKIFKKIRNAKNAHHLKGQKDDEFFIATKLTKCTH